MTTTHRPVVVDIDNLRDVTERRTHRVLLSRQAREDMDTCEREQALAAQQRAWEWRQRDRLMDRCPPSALAPVVRCRPVSVWVRCVQAVRNLF